ncbi:Pre-mRNA-splicing factor syf1, partial [Neolecta irregularis DAH-3]
MEEAASTNPTSDVDLDIRMMRFEHLMDRRPFLVNDVLLRQNPHNVVEWEKRVSLWGDNKSMIVETYFRALEAINPKKSAGKLSNLWVNFAKMYENGDDLQNARTIMEKAIKVPFKSPNELAEIWCQWAEMELRHDQFGQAVELMKKATQAPKKSTVNYFDDSLTPQARLHKSTKLWSFYVDLVESVESLEETKAVYDRIFELKIVTSQTIVNYANLMEENSYFEESFKIYERGLDLFSYPVAFELWNLYLVKFMKRYGGTKLERTRDLFEQALDGCPDKFAKALYLMYAELEEKYGLVRNAMRIYERASKAVAEEDRFEIFTFYITKSAQNFGLTSTRPIYERAIERLPDRHAKD